MGSRRAFSDCPRETWTANFRREQISAWRHRPEETFDVSRPATANAVTRRRIVNPGGSTRPPPPHPTARRAALPSPQPETTEGDVAAAGANLGLLGESRYRPGHRGLRFPCPKRTPGRRARPR